MNTQIKRKIGDLILCTLFLYIMVLIDVLSYGKTVFTEGNNPEIINVGMFIYFYGTIVSQIFFNIFSKIDCGIMASVIIENYYISRKIFSICNTKSIAYSITNTLVSCSISTFLFSIILFVIRFTGIYSYCHYIPKPVFTGCVYFIGGIQLYTGYTIVCHSYISLSLSIVLFLIFLYFEYKYPDAPFIIILVCFIAFIFFHIFGIIINFLFFKANYSDFFIYCVKNKLLSESVDVNLYPSFILKYFSFKLIDFKIILKASKHIISLALFSTIHFPECYPIFKELTGKNFSFANEIKAQAIVNIFSTFTCYPTYFITSDSYAFLKSGGKSRLYGLLSSIPLFTIVFTVPLLNKIMPKFIVGAIPMLIGYYFIIPAIKDHKKYTKLENIMIVLLTIFLCCIEIQIIGISIAIFIFYIIYKYYSIKCKLKPFEIIDNIENTYIIIRVLHFANLKTFKQSLPETDLIIDITEMMSIDRISREFIIRISKNEKYKYIFIGNTQCLKENIEGINITIYDNKIEYKNKVLNR